MSERTAGWGFVAVQACLLAGLILLPGADDWPTPVGVDIAGFALVAVGLGIVGLAALGLGDALTPSPVPTTSATLTTTGLYRLVRHPIYTGVLAVVAGLTVRSGSLVTLALAFGTLIFFTAKSGWEEQRLRERYPDYESYADVTPRFLPRLRHR